MFRLRLLLMLTAAPEALAQGVDASRVTELETASRDVGDLHDAAGFVGRVVPLTDDDRARMMGVSWREGCPTPMDTLRRLTFSRWTSEGTQAEGELIVAASAAEDVLSVFEVLFHARFPVHAAQRVDAFGGDDDASMAANNTSAFNCRKVGGSSRWSEHASGLAIDINPLQNPMVKGERVYPAAGRDWLDRADVRPGMITHGDVVVKAFASIGWKWGGHWRSLKDYQHFSQSGR